MNGFQILLRRPFQLMVCIKSLVCSAKLISEIESNAKFTLSEVRPAFSRNERINLASFHFCSPQYFSLSLAVWRSASAARRLHSGKTHGKQGKRIRTEHDRWRSDATKKVHVRTDRLAG